MPHDLPLITTIVAALGVAFVFGALANFLRVTPLVGYLLAGVLIGPATPGYVADTELAPELAEIGVILLMFGVGLHFSLKDLLSVRATAIPGAIGQIAIATLMGFGLAWWLDWSTGAGLVFGLALSVASTVVLLRALQERRLIETERGRIAIGWLIVEDLVMVLALVLLPALASALAGQGDVRSVDPVAARFGLGVPGVLALTFAKIAAFVAFMLLVGRRIIPWTLHAIAHTGSRELFRLAVLAIALCVAFGAAKLFGVSLALGAFVAGMILSESELSHRAAEESLPLRDAFAVLFFVSVGMLLDPMSIVRDPLPVLCTLFIILIGKSAAAFLIVIAFRHPVASALTISASLAQIGEFSFILADLGIDLNLLSEQGRDLILAGAILSIIANPLVFAAIDWLTPRLEQRVEQWALADRPGTRGATSAAAEGRKPFISGLTGHTVLVGYGRVGSLVGQALKDSNQPFLVIEDADKAVVRLRDAGTEVIVGNAAKPEILQASNLTQADHLIIAIPNCFEAGQIVEQARAAKPSLDIVARAHSDAEVEYLAALGANEVIMGEREIARGMLEYLEPERSRGPEGPSSSPPALSVMDADPS
jgi:monovalent cation:H+ antiporter-2, CPA2 family